MSASGKTNNLKLPVYVEGNETTSWADYNESMQKIDIFAGENKSKTDTNTEAIQTINDQLQTIVTEQNNNNETTQRLDSRVQSIDRNIVTINGTLSSHNQRIEALETEGGEIGSLLTTVTEHTNEIGQLKTDSASQNTQIQKNKTDITAINTEITEIRGDVASVESDITELRNNITRPNTRIQYQYTSAEISVHGFADIEHTGENVNNLFALEMFGVCTVSINSDVLTFTTNADYLYTGLRGRVIYYDNILSSYVSRLCSLSQTGTTAKLTVMSSSNTEFGKGIVIIVAGTSQT